VSRSTKIDRRRSLLGGEMLGRVDGLAATADFEMQLRTGDIAGAA